MAVSFDKPIVCPALVGREEQVAALVQSLDLAAGGHGQTLLVTGEAGIGKSRLVAEARNGAAERGFLALQGDCFEPNRTVPYVPILDLLRAWLGATPPNERPWAEGPIPPELVKLLPELSPRAPDDAPPPGWDPAQEKHRIFHGLAEMIRGLAAAQPVLLVVEDLHWCDETTLDWLLFVARRLATARVLLLLTYRDDEVSAELGHLVAELDRLRLVANLRLSPFSTSDVATMLRATFELPHRSLFAPGRLARADLVGLLHGQSEGNPFFIEEMLRALVAAGDIRRIEDGWDCAPVSELRIRLPRSVGDAVRRRSVGLHEGARQTLTLAAVAGRHVEFGLLWELRGCGEGALLADIKDLIAAGLLVEETAERFAFRHELTRQAVLAGLLAWERQALHRQIVETLQRLHPDASARHLDELAYHAHAAGDWSTALNLCRRAGERAQALDAPRAAAEHFTRALEAADHLRLAPDPTLLRARGQAHETLGNFERALADHEAAMNCARAGGDRRTEWQALVDLGFLWTSRDYARAGAHFTRALDLAREIGDPALVAHTLNRVGNWHVNREQPHEGQKHHQEALATFEKLNNPTGIAETLDLLGTSSMLAGEPGKGRRHYQRAATIFQQIGDRRGLSNALASMSHIGATLINYGLEDAVELRPDHPPPSGGSVEDDLDQALRIAREIGWPAGQAYALGELSWNLVGLGRYGRALAAAREALAIVEEIGHRQWMVAGLGTLSMLHLDLLAPALARRHAETALQIAQESGSLYWSRLMTGLLVATAALQRGVPPAVEALAAMPTDYGPAPTAAERLLWCAKAELAIAQGDPAGALAIIDRLPPVTDGTGRSNAVRVAKLRGEALTALGHGTEAEEALLTARAGAVRHGARPMLWRIDLLLGRLLHSLGRRDEADQAFAAARALIDELATEVPEEAMREHFLIGAAACLPAGVRISPRRAAEPAGDGLTEREREVASLLIRGLSNRQIAELLFVSEWTIATHVRNTLAKLGFTSRTQIAAWALERGLGADRSAQ